MTASVFHFRQGIIFRTESKGGNIFSFFSIHGENCFISRLFPGDGGFDSKALFFQKIHLKGTGKKLFPGQFRIFPDFFHQFRYHIFYFRREHKRLLLT